MSPLKELLTEIDARWKPLGGEPVALQIIGSAALMLQTVYDRGTKDGDVLGSRDGSAAVDEQLRALVARFEAAVDRFTLDARALDIPRYLKNLHIVERDILGVQPSRIELPPECLSD